MADSKRSIAVLVVTWFVLLLDVFWLAPSERPSSLDLFRRAMTFDLQTFDPAVIALFYATGIIVTLHGSLLWAEAHESKPHPILVVLIGYALGSLFLLPYYAFRRAGARRPAAVPWPAGRAIRVVLALELGAAAVYGLAAGSLRNLLGEVTSRRFSHCLLIDFVVLFILLVALGSGRLAPRIEQPA